MNCLPWGGAVSPEVRCIAAELLPTFYGQLKRIAQDARSHANAGYPL
jgi:hypothetical protein